MELSRTEYPSIVNSVRPSPAVKLVRERLQKGQGLNVEISDWLQERRRVEDAYVLALTKLSKRPLPGDNLDLGIFAAPWLRIVESTSSIAVAHQHFSDKLNAEVERPIREFASRNGDWSAMKSLETNLNSVAKSIESTEERAEKLRKRGTKAKAQQVAEAATAVTNAFAEWDSQAPFVFEKLQAADESRCNNLRDALTRLQTLESDRAQTTIKSADLTLGIILDINTNDEIKAFAHKATVSLNKIERHPSRSANAGTINPSTPSIVTDDSVSVQSSHSGGATSGGVGTAHGGLGLKRLGTVLRNRNRNSMFHRSASPDKRSSDRSGKGHPPLPPSPQVLKPGTPNSDSNTLTVPPPPMMMETDQHTTTISGQNGTGHSTLTSPETASNPANATNSPVPTNSEIPRTDAEGYTIPPSNHDLVGTAAGLHDEVEEHQPQFKVEIKNDVIHEEEEEADAALSKVANTLRAQNTVSRKTRGRRDARDVRNTMFIANPPEITEHLTGSPPLTPRKSTTRPSNVNSETGSDTQSIKSSRSVTSLSTSPIKHPDLTKQGLSTSLVELVSMSYEAGQPVKSHVTGEIALAYNQEDNFEPPSSITIRMDNFSVLEKVAPNPAFISAVPDSAGEYTITPQNIRKTSVAFKYQVHVDEANLTSYSPIIIIPVWRLETHQSSVIVTWKPNPEYRQPNQSNISFTLRNIVFITGIEGVYTTSCQSKPVGTFSRERGRLAWKLDDLHINTAQCDNQGGKLLARFATEGLARPMPVEIRWEITGDEADNVGSGLTLSALLDGPKIIEEETDPFADTSGEEKCLSVPEPTTPSWSNIVAVKKISSGKYTAI
ncbi:Muniscin C-terminal mu homology domain-containing protein [Geopyxis carbonaria]|nr:Muniscin C-terminal mu homology domain-containing protein [Geopyxis carbonaria]